MNVVIGIDPGLSGCMMAVDIDTFNPISFIDISKIGEHINIEFIVKWLDQFDKNISVACENPHIHTGDGINTLYQAFRYGYSVGTIQAIIIALGFNVELIYPMTWKSHFNLISSTLDYDAKKQLDLDRAIELSGCEDVFMSIKQHGNKQRIIYHHDRADAYLIARYMIETGEK